MLRDLNSVPNIWLHLILRNAPLTVSTAIRGALFCGMPKQLSRASHRIAGRGPTDRIIICWGLVFIERVRAPGAVNAMIYPRVKLGHLDERE